jgi:hypothetical protein
VQGAVSYPLLGIMSILIPDTISGRILSPASLLHEKKVLRQVSFFGCKFSDGLVGTPVVFVLVPLVETR